ncbi:hypothetical protein [Bradyrhizobium centrolobii]|uniref:hypothetical protein n=1 Tax=Bradyrhizobium centrolobii TaxID=1505087 RepID=UPI0010A95AA7|nr:hypothetical protein [Bradyrhizobium centrolobii]
MRNSNAVNALAETTTGHTEAENDRSSLVDDLRTLVHSVTVHPNGPRQGFEFEVKDGFAALVGGEVFPQAHNTSPQDG